MDQINSWEMVHKDGILRDSYEKPLIDHFLFQAAITEQEFEESKKPLRY